MAHALASIAEGGSETAVLSRPPSSPQWQDQFTAGRFVAFIAAVMGVLFPNVLLGTKTFFYRDYGVLAYPTIYHAHASFWRGELPLWNPYSNCGVPFLAQWGTMVLYPFSLVYLLLPLPWSLSVFCLAHLVLAAIGMYKLAERWTNDRFAASVAGTGFLFNGVTLSCLMWPNYTVALGWMPWVILWVEGGWQPNQSWRPVVRAALASTLQMLAGVPELVLLTWMILAGLWVGEALCRRHNAPPLTGHSKAKGLISRPAVIVLLATALLAAQLIPFLDLLTHSQRNGSTATLKWALPPWGWGNLVNPMFRCVQTPQGMFFQLAQEFFTSTYLGVPLLVLALAGLSVVRERRVWLLGGLSLFGLLLAFGDHGFLYRGLRSCFPCLGFLRYPVKFMLLPAFGVPLLAGYGIKALRIEYRETGWSQRAWMISAGLVVLALSATLVLTWWRPTRFDQWPVVWHSVAWRVVFLGAMLVLLRGAKAGLVTASGILLLLLADALVAVPEKNPVLPASVMAPGLWELSQQQAANRTNPGPNPSPESSGGRVMISAAAEEQLLTSAIRDLKADFLIKRLALWSNLNLLEQVQKVNGSSTLQIREQKEIESVMYGPHPKDCPALADFLNAAQVTAPGPALQWSQRPNCLPLVTAGQKPEFADQRDVIQSVTGDRFDPRESVWLAPEAKPFVQATRNGAAQVKSTRWSTHSLEADVEATQPSMVVIAQSYYHAWRALLDGQPQRLWRANGAYQALAVPAGRHRVELVYVDWGFRIGLAISLLGLLICGVLWRGLSPTAGDNGECV